MYSSKACPDLLWIDLRTRKKTKPLSIPTGCNSAVFDGSFEAELSAVLSRGLFKVLVFHYDAPTSSGLRLLEKTKASHPSLPIILVTEAHSEALAVWALRTRVWDYFVEPIDPAELMLAVGKLLDIKASNALHRPTGREHVTRISARPNHLARDHRKDIVALARDFIEKNFHRNISQKELADHLNVSHAHLSRLFKQQGGRSFSQLLWDARISAAKMLMLDTEASVTEICYEVGCSDPGYFATKFRAETDMTPSEYRERVSRSRLANACIVA
jgi:YesN/AraC family two-component response regulator